MAFFVVVKDTTAVRTEIDNAEILSSQRELSCFQNFCSTTIRSVLIKVVLRGDHMLCQVITSSSSHLIHAHCIWICVTVFTFLLSTEGWSLCLRCLSSMQNVIDGAVRRRTLCDTTQDGKMRFSTHRMVNLLIGLLVNDPASFVFDLHRRLQCYRHISMAADLNLALPSLTSHSVGLRDGGWTSRSTSVHHSLSAALHRSWNVVIDDDCAGMRPSCSRSSALITSTMPEVTQASFDRCWSSSWNGSDRTSKIVLGDRTARLSIEVVTIVRKLRPLVRSSRSLLEIPLSYIDPVVLNVLCKGAVWHSVSNLVQTSCCYHNIWVSWRVVM